MDVIDGAVSAAARGARDVPAQALPAKGLAVLTCMDARIDPMALLGLHPGDAHVVRNAGGVVTPDVVESLALSQEHFGTRSIMVVQHTRCAALEGASAEETVREAVRLLRTESELPGRDAVRGFVLDIGAGTLTEVAGSTFRPVAPPRPAGGRSPAGPRLARCRSCGRSFDPRASSRRRERRSYCGDLCRLAARTGKPAVP